MSYIRKCGLKSHNYHKRIISLILCIILICSCMFFVEPKVEVNSQTVYSFAYVYSSDGELNVRSGAGVSYTKTDTLYNGHQVSVIEKVHASDGSTWNKISYFNGKSMKFGYVNSAYLKTVSASADSAFETYLSRQNFPESYKSYLRVLHELHPEWTFQAFRTNLDWNEVLEAETEFGQSAVEKSSISSWKSLEDGAYDWTTSTWAIISGSSFVAASDELVAFYLDPRNFLNDQQIFQFELVSYNDDCQTEEAVEAVLKGTFMSHAILEGNMTYAQALIRVGKELNVSPCMLASRVRQEQGTAGTNKLISGTVSGYEGYYNYFNINASGSSAAQVLKNGLEEAVREGWNSRYKALVGGAKKVVTGHIQRGQDTLYLQKFDVDSTYDGLFWHQYMQNIQAASHEGVNVRNSYAQCGAIESSFLFKIPVYENMPEYACELPINDGNPNYKLKSISVSGYSLSPTFKMDTLSYTVMVSNSVSSVTVRAEAYSSKTTISGTGTVSLKSGTNTLTVKSTAENGMYRNYTLNVIRSAASSSTAAAKPTSTASAATTATAKATVTATAKATATATATASPIPTKAPATYSLSKYTISDSKYVSGVNEGTKVSSVMSNVTVKNCSAKVVSKDGKSVPSDSAVATGQKIVITDTSSNVIAEFSVVLYGDLNGDGKIGTLDYVYIKRHLWDVSSLEGVYCKAADISPSKGNVDALDFVYMKRHLWGISDIEQ